MPRKNMSSPEKRRPGGGLGTTKGPSSLRSPSLPPRSSARGNANPTTHNTFIAPPPRAALSRSSSPVPDHLHNGNNSNNTTNTNTNTNNKDPDPPSYPVGAAALAAATALAARDKALLREKDLRIASLERELAIMESEFQRERDRLSSAESEAAGFWQSKYAALERQLRQLVARAEEQEEEEREEEEEEEEEDDEDEHEDQDQNEGRRGGAVNGREAELRIVLEAAKKALVERDAEIAELRAQVRGLKEWVSNSTRSDGQAQTSDEVFGEGMARLGNGLQNWVLVNFRRAKINLSNADEATILELGRLVPMYEDLAATSKIHLLQSIVSRLLVELVFDAYFVGLPNDMAQQLTQVETFLASFAASPESVNQWRSLTLTILKKDAIEKMETETSAVMDMVVCRVNTLLDSITNITSTDTRDQGLQVLVRSAIELSRLLAVQKAVFKVEMPEIVPYQRTMFDAETMEDIGGEDEENLADRDICCVTFPGIIKRGDESGGQLQYRNVISKARVLCGPEKPLSSIGAITSRRSDIGITFHR
ncbi:Involucrin repeat protein [Madurella fahalii]|uniref:Involucrin repeat protein n=1 Tax=Madurella fahalii TaxID=1157608 RepID=A0ABQ0G5D7_9PEZI